MIKPEIRVIGIDDGVFASHTRGVALVVGVVFRGGYWLDGVIHTKVEVDGFDATDRIRSLVVDSPHYRQLRVIMLDGITFAGFNIVDIQQLSTETRLPVMTVTRDRPDFDDIHKALQNLPRNTERWEKILKAGEPSEVPAGKKGERVYLQFSGIAKDDAIEILKLTSTRSNIPEALRVAHLIASGVSEI